MVSSGDGFIDIQTNNIVVGQSCDGVAMPADIVFTKAQSIRFERNTFIHLGAQGLAIERGSRNNSVIGNVFTDISGTGLRIGTFDTPNATGADQDVGNVISNNYIHDLPVEYHGGVGIFAGYVANTLLSHNEIMNMPYSGISNGWGWNGSASYANNNQIKNNLIYNYMQLLADGGGIYSNGIQGSSIENGEHIEGNVVHDGRNDYSNGIYTDGGSQYITIQNNVLYNNIHDWGGCNPNGDMLFQYNYWQKSLPSWGCDQTPPNTVIANNTTINGSDQAPISILNSAGIEHAYQDIKDGSPSGNVALNMPSGASSEWSTDCSSSKANDGSVNTNDSCGGWSPSSQDANPWWEVDLGHKYHIASLELVTRQNCCDSSDTRQDFEVLASNDPTFATYSVIGKQGSTVIPFQGTWSTVVNDPNSYRYIRATKTGYFFISRSVIRFAPSPGILLGWTHC